MSSIAPKLEPLMGASADLGSLVKNTLAAAPDWSDKS
jgi:hypothetical protein